MKECLNPFNWAKIPGLRFAKKINKHPPYTPIEFLKKETKKSTPTFVAHTTKDDMIKTLKSNGYKHSTTKDGKDILTKGDKSYLFYTATGGGIDHAWIGKPAVDFKIGKNTVQKIRIGK